MAAIIRRASQLPEWFNLEKYCSLSMLDCAGWYEQLLVRANLQTLIKDRDRATLDSSGISDLLDAVQASPVVDTTSSETLSVHFYGRALPELRERKLLYSRGIRQATVSDLFLAEKSLFPPVLAYARNYFLLLFGGNWDAIREAGGQPWMDSPLKDVSAPSRSKLLCINTALSDSVLIEQFKQLLPALRVSEENSQNAERVHRRPDSASWISFGVLPYLDLKLWAQVEGVQIPNRVFADAIFPPGEGGEEVVRKTTSKIADQVLTDTYLQELAAIAALEIAEQGTE